MTVGLSAAAAEIVALSNANFGCEFSSTPQHAKELLRSMQLSEDGQSLFAAVAGIAVSEVPLGCEELQDTHPVASADSAPYQDSTPPVSPRGDGWSGLNTENRTYLFLVYDTWFEYHNKDEIILCLESQRADGKSASCDQVVRKIDEFLSEHSGRAHDMRERHLKAAVAASQGSRRGRREETESVPRPQRTSGARAHRSRAPECRCLRFVLL
eukprot:g45618.t1